MIPATYPSILDSSNRTKMLVYQVPSITGLTRWVDYIPVKSPVSESDLSLANTYANEGFILTSKVNAITGLVPFKDYVPIYFDSTATKAWSADNDGYIPMAEIANFLVDFTTGSLDQRISFLRTSNATVTNSAGLITYAPHNLLTYSEQFDNSAWGKASATITANAGTSPNGTLTADLLGQATGQTLAAAVFGSISQTSPATFSVYAKANTKSKISLLTSATNAETWFNLSNGTVGTIGINHTATITDAGNGWYRCSVTASVALTNQSIYLADTDGSRVVTDSGSVFLWGAQLEVGASPTAYNPTTVKNLLGFTQEFDNAAWTKSNSFVQSNLLLQSEDFLTTWATTNLTVTTNTQIAPTGNLTADTLADTVANANHNTLQSIAWAATSYTFSAYVKYNTHRWIGVRIGATGNQFFGSWDLQNNVVGSATVGSTIGMTFVGNGWYRITLTATLTSAATANLIIQLNNADAVALTSYAGTGTSFYIWGAQLVQGAVAGDYVRTSSTVMPVMYQAPNGTLSADKLVEDTATSDHRINQASLSLGAGIQTYSIYAKSSERNVIRVQVDGTIGGLASNATVDVNLDTGAVGTPTFSNNITSPSATATSVGNGWYRIRLTFTVAVAATGITARVFVMQTVGGASSYAGNGTSGIYIWGAQLSDSASLDPYVYNPVAAPTAQAYYGPRFDYDPVTKQPKGLLIEEQRTNLLLQSEAFNDAYWNKVSTTISANNTTSPDGTISADKITEDVANNTHQLSSTTVSVTNGTTYTFSIYAKKAERQYLTFNGSSAFFGGQDFCIYDLNSGVITQQGTSGQASITDVGNGWYRCLRTIPATATGNSIAAWGISNSSTGGRAPIYTGDGVSGFYIWGAQLELGAFATSVIPTQASQVTRAADTAVIQGSNFSSWYNQNEGTVYVDITYTGQLIGSATATNIIRIDDSTGNNVTDLRIVRDPTLPQSDVVVVANGSNQMDSAGLQPVIANTKYKRALAYSINNAISCNNGTLDGATDTSFIPPFVNRLLFGTGSNQSFYLSNFSYYNARLSNATLQAITS